MTKNFDPKFIPTEIKAQIYQELLGVYTTEFGKGLREVVLDAVVPFGLIDEEAEILAVVLWRQLAAVNYRCCQNWGCKNVTLEAPEEIKNLNLKHGGSPADLQPRPL